MKGTDRKLKQLLRSNPVHVEPKRKAELLARIGEYTEHNTEYKEETEMRKRPVRRIFVIAALIAMFAMLVSAAAVVYYYRTPDGGIVDGEGNPAETAESVASGENDHVIFGTGYSIPAVTWTTAGGRTTLAVWATRDSTELIGLSAVIGGEAYPLTKATFNLSGNLVGYTAENVPEPTVFTLTCESPAFTETVNFQPQDVIPAECTSNGLTLFGTTVGNTVYLGVNDADFLSAELAGTARLALVVPEDAVVTDTAGAQIHEHRGGSNRDDALMTYSRFEITEGASVASLRVEHIKLIYNFMDTGAVQAGTAPHGKIPVPADGETLSGDWTLLDSDGFSYRVTSVRREKNELTFTAPSELTYQGEYSIAEDWSGSYIYAGISGVGMISCGGSDAEWTMYFAGGELEKYMDENGEIDVCIGEMGIVCEGEWELNFE